jgi:RND family efflux transporter MFP subunit
MTHRLQIPAVPDLAGTPRRHGPWRARGLLPAVALALLLAAPGPGRTAAAEIAEPYDAFGPPRDAATRPLEGFDCLIEPFTEVDVSTRVDGILEAFDVERGEVIEQGQPLARIESSVERIAVQLARTQADMAAALEERRQNLAFAERQRDRVQQLYGDASISLEEKDLRETEAVLAALQLEQVLHEQDVARLELRRAEIALELRTLRSPVDGVVVERLLSPGESTEQRPVIRVARLDPLAVEIIVPAELYGRIRPGMEADVTPSLPGAEARRATVSIVDRVVDAASGTFGVRLTLPNPDYELPGGLRCAIRFRP